MTGIEAGLANAAGQALIDTVADTRGTFGKIFGPAITEFGGMLGDKVREWRFRNLANIMGRVQKLADERQLPPENLKALPFGDAIRVIEAASEEEDESVAELWARLLANAAGPAKSNGVTKVHVDILKSISASEAAFMELMFRFPPEQVFRPHAEKERWEKSLSEAAECNWRKFTVEDRDIAIQNLKRLRCITFRPDRINNYGLLARLPRDGSRGWGSGDFAVVDRHKFEELINNMSDMIGAAAGIHEYREHDRHARFQTDRPPERLYMLTALGQGLMKACS